MIDVLLCDAMLVRHFRLLCLFFFFFFNDTATTEIYTLSLHDALPQSRVSSPRPGCSTLTTSAPRSASAMAHMGPASTRERSRTRTPSSGREEGGALMRNLVEPRKPQRAGDARAGPHSSFVYGL